MMDEPTAWLREVWDADERSARAIDSASVILTIGDTVRGSIPPEDSKFRSLIDPTDLLARIDAERRILDVHRPVRVRSTGDLGEDFIERCSMCDQFPAQYPCSTVRLIAWGYRHRPGYREEWRP
ncbi:DUF6221 family protein [Streptomonospora litoralis]|uniref:Uncharacterized protein n=1 Tax=Streptomonospora litoralis TaxID=2498135 RepID=A0A4P6QB33_9ACTN|nr:DUF6221 family protein [Streptomonospora litoralis]QBI56754.1 hypothetical protein EKD16_25065 [Streptomonospora litoralis]